MTSGDEMREDEWNRMPASLEGKVMCRIQDLAEIKGRR